LRRKRRAAFGIISVLLVITAMISAAFVRMSGDELIFWIMLGATSIVALVFLVLFIANQKDFRSFISDNDERWASVERDSLFRFPIPAAVVGEDDTILWYNVQFGEEIYKGDAFGLNITDITPLDLAKSRSDAGEPIELISGKYKVTALTSDKKDVSGKQTAALTMLCFEDISDELELKAKLLSERADVILITIDNFDEMLGNEKASEKTHILIQIDKIIEEYSERFGGIMRKTSDDKYFIILSSDSLRQVKEDKFSILDKLRTITLGEKSTVTVSIGIGISEGVLTDAENLAREALEMAQGRGGDQAVIKNGNDYEFFGGVSGGTERTTKAKTRMVANSVLSIASNATEIILMGHKYGDMDSMGAAAGLAGALKIAYPDTPIKICTDLEHSMAKQIVYRLSDNLPDGEELFISPEDAEELMTPEGLLIIVDTSNRDLLESIELYEKSKNIIVIDHHRQTTRYVDNALLLHIEPYASSASEIVTEIIQYFSEIKRVSSYYFDALLAGIMLDTKNFIMKTGSRTFEAAAFLRKQGADTVAVKRLFADNIETIKRRSELIASAVLYKHCAVASDDSGSPDARVFAAQAADEMLSIDGADASFVIFKTSSGTSISARAMGAMNVQIIMEKLGGGGHHTMAAAQLSETTVDEAKKILLGAIDEHIANIT
jgi:c-di-AMP phosphodiesterase-like protein